MDSINRLISTPFATLQIALPIFAFVLQVLNRAHFSFVRIAFPSRASCDRCPISGQLECADVSHVKQKNSATLPLADARSLDKDAMSIDGHSCYLTSHRSEGDSDSATDRTTSTQKALLCTLCLFTSLRVYLLAGQFGGEF